MPGPLGESKNFHITYQQSLRHISLRLFEEQIIDHPRFFEILIRLQKIYKGKHEAALKAGHYEFLKHQSMADVIEKLQNNKVRQFTFTIIEGSSNQMIEHAVNHHDGFKGNKVEINPDSFLLPDSWFVEYGSDRDQFIERVQKKGQQVLYDLWNNRSPYNTLKTPYEALILASIVERESAHNDEMKKIAGVFFNRLKKNMRLQSDPTVIYALTNGLYALQKKLTRQHLKTDSPFNTYRYHGLPPFHIANPSLAALQAVMNPLQSDDLYFVADGQGRHFFAKTLKEHNKNVRKYRNIIKNQKNKTKP
ncbi:MAG: endolytic transglycosylase MltG [Pseudomonadota bacterium]